MTLFAFLSFYKGEVERPPQSRDCSGRVPLTLGHISPTEISKLTVCFGALAFIFVVLRLEKQAFLRARELVRGKRAGVAASGSGPLLCFLSLGL